MAGETEPNLQGTYRMVVAAARLIQRRQNEALAPLNMTRAAVIALEAIAPRPLNQEQLAAKVHVQSQTLGRVLARLEAGGYVIRTRNPEDRRQLHVQLTPAGRAVLVAARQAELDAFPSTLNAQDWNTLQQHLGRFVEALKIPSRPAGLPQASEPEPRAAPVDAAGSGAAHESLLPPRSGSVEP